MYNIIAMNHPNLKPDNSILFKSLFLMKQQNIIILDFTTFLFNIVALKRDSVTLKKKRFALERNSVALKRACCGEEVLKIFL